MTENLEPFTIEEWRKRPGDLRYVNGSAFEAATEMSAHIVCATPCGTVPLIYGPSGRSFDYLRLVAPKPKLVEVRFCKCHDKLYFEHRFSSEECQSKFGGWRTLYNMDTGEPIARVGVEQP